MSHVNTNVSAVCTIAGRVVGASSGATKTSGLYCRQQQPIDAASLHRRTYVMPDERPPCTRAERSPSARMTLITRQLCSIVNDLRSLMRKLTPSQ
jgi:hypothetical protein